jgi:hypothetical protein
MREEQAQQARMRGGDGYMAQSREREMQRERDMAYREDMMRRERRYPDPTVPPAGPGTNQRPPQDRRPGQMDWTSAVPHPQRRWNEEHREYRE